MKKLSCYADLTGRTFGRLTVTEDSETRGRNSKQKTRYWRCLCLCGREIWARASHLSGNVTSCGCLSRERARTANLRHGHSVLNTRAYRSWHAMLARCRDKNRDGAHRYVERGITVCEQWQRFENFLQDMGPCPPNKTIHRINNDLGYFPGNCKWASLSEQGTNKCNAKLTYEMAVEIALRRLRGEKCGAIAKDYAVDPSRISTVSRGKGWKGAYLTAALHRSLEDIPCD